MTISINVFMFLLVVIYAAAYPMKSSSFYEKSKNGSEVTSLAAAFGDMNLYDAGDCSVLPQELLIRILSMKFSELPWDNLICIYKVTTVCKRWYIALADVSTICQLLGIKQLHFASMTDNVDEIIELTYHHKHSPLEPDEHGYRAAHYALGRKKYKAMKLLKMGLALDIPWKDPNELKMFVIDHDEKSLQLLVAIVDPEEPYTEHDIINAVESGNVDKLDDLLLALGDDKYVVIEALKGDVGAKKISGCDAICRNHLLYTIKSYMEAVLFSELNKLQNPEEIFWPLFKQYEGNPNACDEKGNTFLHRVCMKKQLGPTLPHLLTCDGIDLNTHNSHNYDETPFHTAAFAGNDEALKALIKTGKCDVNAVTKGKLKAIDYASVYGSIDCIKLLMQHNTYTDHSKPLHMAVAGCNTGVLAYLLETGKFYVDHLNELHRTPLHIASLENSNNSACAEILIDRGANVNAQDNDGFTPVHYAVQEGNIEILRCLTKIPLCNIETQNNNGETPLALAVRLNEIDCAIHLINNQANLTWNDKVGRSLLHIAAMYGSSKREGGCMRLLIDKGAVIDAKDHYGETPLHYAACYGYSDCIGVLIKHGASIECQFQANTDDDEDSMFDGCTPLHAAAYHGCLEAVKELIGHGADVRAKTRGGDTALQLAAQQRHEDIVTFLIAYRNPSYSQKKQRRYSH